MEFGSVELDSAAGYVDDGSPDLLACVLGDAGISRTARVEGLVPMVGRCGAGVAAGVDVLVAEIALGQRDGIAGGELLLDEDDVEQVGGEADAVVEVLHDAGERDLGDAADQQQVVFGAPSGG